MKLQERVVEAKLRGEVMISKQQYGLMLRKSATGAMVKMSCTVSVDLDKSYVRVPREDLWYCMRKSALAEKYMMVVQDSGEE